MSIKYIIISVLFILSSNEVCGQLGKKKLKYQRGYFVTKTDSVSCYLESRFSYSDHFQNTGYSGNVLSYKLKITDEKVLNVDLHKVIKLKSVYYYERVEIKKGTELMKLLVDGEVKLYESRRIGTSTAVHTGYNGMMTTSSGTPYDKVDYFLKKNGQLYKVNSKKKLALALNDCPEILKVLNEMEKYRYEYKIKDLVRKYNYWLYEKNK